VTGTNCEGIVSAFDIESLLHEVKPDARCGDDLSHSGEFLELETLVQPKPPGAIQTAEPPALVEPNWMEVRQRAWTLLQKSRDLQVALYFSLALFTTEGIVGLRDGLYLIQELLERFWEDLHPRLDPEDDNDPTQRINILLPLSSEPPDPWDPVRFRSRLLRHPLCSSPGVGGFSLRDIQISRGEIAVVESGREAPKPAVIQAAFRGMPAEKLQNTLRAAREAKDCLDGICGVFQRQTRDGSGPELGGLGGDLERICRVLGDATGADPGAGHAGPAGVRSASTEKEPVSTTGEIRSRDDALAAIERACRYFENQEPSSPVPLLLRRAQRLAPKTFLEIIADVCPSAIDQVTVVSGSSGDGPANAGPV
jgi:type VI secretion system protein ImpA